MSTRTWVEEGFQPALVALMQGCVVYSLVRFIELVAPRWNGSYLVLFCLVTSIEARITYRLHQRHLLHVSGGLRFRVIELAALFLLLQLWGDLYEHHPLLDSGFPRIDEQTLVFFIPVILCWLSSTGTTRDLDAIGEPPVHDATYISPPQRLASRFFAGGTLLFAVAGMTEVGLQQLFNFSRTSVSGPVFNVVLYFLLGMLMLGQIRYTSLQRRWAVNGTQVRGAIASPWIRYSFGFLTLVAVVAFVLPTSYGFGLLDLLNSAAELLSAIVVLLTLIVTYPLGLLLSLLAPHHHLQIHAGPTGVPKLPPMQHTPAGSDVIKIIRSVLFWLVTGITVLYMLRIYARQQRRRLPPPPAFLRRLVTWMRSVWKLLRQRAQQYGSSLRTSSAKLVRRRRTDTKDRERPHRVRWRGLTAREHVLYYYLSIVERADRQGVHRTPSQTPGEFEAMLQPHLGEAQGEMQSLTDAFLEAKYSQHSIPDARAGLLRRSWQRVRAALRAHATRNTSI